jgi:hypothetical protein
VVRLPEWQGSNHGNDESGARQEQGVPESR